MSNRGVNHEFNLVQMRGEVIDDIEKIMSEHRQKRKDEYDKRFVLFEPRDVKDPVLQFDDFAYNFNEMQRLPEVCRYQNSQGKYIGFAVVSVTMTRANELIFNTRAMEKDMWEQPFLAEDISTETLIQILIKMEEKK